MCVWGEGGHVCSCVVDLCASVCVLPSYGLASLLQHRSRAACGPCSKHSPAQSNSCRPDVYINLGTIPFAQGGRVWVYSYIQLVITTEHGHDQSDLLTVDDAMEMVSLQAFSVAIN